MQTIHTMCVQLVFGKFVNPHQINTKVQLPTFIHTSPKFAKPVDPIGMKMPNFRLLRLIILLQQEFKEKSTFMHDTA